MLHLLIAVNNSWVGDKFVSISLICSSDIYFLRQLISFSSNISLIPVFELFFSLFSLFIWDSIFIFKVVFSRFISHFFVASVNSIIWLAESFWFCFISTLFIISLFVFLRIHKLSSIVIPISSSSLSKYPHDKNFSNIDGDISLIV